MTKIGKANSIVTVSGTDSNIVNFMPSSAFGFNKNNYLSYVRSQGNALEVSFQPGLAYFGIAGDYTVTPSDADDYTYTTFYSIPAGSILPIYIKAINIANEGEVNKLFGVVICGIGSANPTTTLAPTTTLGN
jgi:hypothetical protein